MVFNYYWCQSGLSLKGDDLIKHTEISLIWKGVKPNTSHQLLQIPLAFQQHKQQRIAVTAQDNKTQGFFFVEIKTRKAYGLLIIC